jgi:hypothetical protein
MNLPSLTAEASVYRSSIRYLIGYSTVETPPREFVPAYMPGTATMQSCNDCLQDCVNDNLICQGLAVAGTAICCAATVGLFCGGCVAAGAAASGLCDTTMLGCMAKCDISPCCPKLCGFPDPLNPGSGCCDSGESCVNQNDPNAREGCCPVGQAVCDGSCCAPGATCCGNSCCPQGSVCMQGVCCPAGTTALCNGQCCDGACDAAGNCCVTPNYLCGTQCCSAFNQCCNGTCCATGSVCAAGSCCPQAQACGDTCCPSGQQCQDPTTGTCSACPAGTTSVICEGGSFGQTACCPPGVACCNGQCCPYASDQNGEVICCDSLFDTPPFHYQGYGCHHVNSCSEP